MKIKFFLLAAFAICISCSQKQDFADFADPFVGVRDGGSNCVLGPMLPYGSINPSPHSAKGEEDGYKPGKPVRGFAQCHVSGTGWPTYGHFLVSPQTGLEPDPLKHESEVSNIDAKVYSLSMDLDRYGIKAEVTPAHYSAIYRFTYPESDESSLVFDASQAIAQDIMLNVKGQIKENEASIDPKTGEVRMMLLYLGGWPREPYRMFLVGNFNKKPAEYGCFNGSEILKGQDNISYDGNGHIGTYAKFSTKKGEEVLFKAAISFTSYDKARELLDKEIKGWNYGKVLKAAKEAWNGKLSTIDIEACNQTDSTIFYSALFRAFTASHERSLDCWKWETDRPYWDDNYALWDTFRTIYPLYMLVDEDALRSNLLALRDRQEHEGAVYDTFVAGTKQTGEQGGNDIDNMIVDAYIKGLTGVDWEEMYAIVKHNADNRRNEEYREKGWRSRCGGCCSSALEYAYNDYDAAILAKGLGHEEDAAKYLERSRSWRNIWNPELEAEGFKGFVDPRDENGDFCFLVPNEFGGARRYPFYESDSWTYSYYVPHEMDTLVARMGGSETFVQRLQFALANEKINYTNEPAFLVTKAFSHAGRPDLSSYWTHEIMNKHYDLEGYPGNEDTGAMASWYVFGAIGIYPSVGQDLYYLTAPKLKKAVLTLAGGKKLTITANAAPQNVYIKSCRFNGEEWNSPFFSHSDIANGGTIEFELSDTATDWGR